MIDLEIDGSSNATTINRLDDEAGQDLDLHFQFDCCSHLSRVVREHVADIT